MTKNLSALCLQELMNLFVQAFDNNSNKITSILKITKNDLKKNFPSENILLS